MIAIPPPLRRRAWQNPLFGWLAACASASAVVTSFVSGALTADTFVSLLGLAALFSFLPCAVTIVVCELWRVRKLIWYVLAGLIAANGTAIVLIGSFEGSELPLMSAVGVAMAVTYWLISGRFSGMGYGPRPGGGA